MGEIWGAKLSNHWVCRLNILGVSIVDLSAVPKDVEDSSGKRDQSGDPLLVYGREGDRQTEKNPGSNCEGNMGLYVHRNH